MYIININEYNYYNWWICVFCYQPKYATPKEERSVHMCVVPHATISKMRQLFFMRFQCFALTVQPGKVQPGRSKLSPVILC